MNKCYKSIYNEQTGTWIAVAENVSAKSKRSSSARVAIAHGALMGIAALSGMTFSLNSYANIWQSTGACNSSDTGASIDGTVAYGPTSGHGTDGSGTYSTIVGCDSDGNGFLGATAIGMRATVTGKGGTAVGIGTVAGQYASALDFKPLHQV